MMINVNFRDDLTSIVRSYFSQKHISYDEEDKAEDLATRYCEMRIRHIDPVPRQVHFSRELNGTLGSLATETDSQDREKTLEAWNAVFHLWKIFTDGGDLTPYLSENIRDATSTDGLLWDYGMHHFHLRSGFKEPGLIKRSDYLLFAIIADCEAFFVDVRKHRDPQHLQWVRHDLLQIVYTNWPGITSARVLRGVDGSTLTNEEKKELRRKHVNTVVELDGHAMAPLGWGTTGNGGSLWCSVWAIKLLREIDWHVTTLENQPEKIRAILEAKGVTTSNVIDLRLVPLDCIDVSPALAEHLLEGDHLSKGLCSMGFAVVEATSGYPVIITENRAT